jgi:ankyrin repeat protein
MLLLILTLAIVLLPVGQPSWAVGREEQERKQGQQALSIAIVSARGKSGSLIINRAGSFQVRLTNRSSRPIRLWKEWCRFGYEALSFRAKDGSGQSSLMKKKPRSPSDWENKPPKTITLPPGGAFSWEVTPSGIWGEREWKNVPEPNTGRPVQFQAIFQIQPTKVAKKYGVWTGKVTSEPVKALFVDPKLRTPHQYLEAHCPNQALRLIRADPKWMNRRDDYHQTPLHLAARLGFKKVVRWLLAHGADVNATAYNHFTPLHLAEDPAVVKILLKAKADVNAGGPSETALERAASNYASLGQYSDPNPQRDKWRAIIKILLRAGARYDLNSACYLGDVKRVRALFADKKQVHDKEALRIAAMFGRAKIVKLFLEHGADPEDSGSAGLPVSYFAVQHAPVLKLLFDAVAKPKITLKFHGIGRAHEGSTLLHEAADKGIIESAKLLLARGVKVDVRDPSGFTPLHWACSEGQVRMVEFLLKHKANARARTKDGWNPMSLAASKVRPDKDEDNARYQAVIRALERAGAKVDVFAAIACNDVRRVVGFLRVDPKAGATQDPEGQPALYQAVELDRREIVKQLLLKGCDPNVRNKKKSVDEGETALHSAAFWGHVKVAAMLIRQGAKVNARDTAGVTPLHEAGRMGHLNLCRLLLKHGADVNAKDRGGNTPLDWARVSQESSAVLKLLREHGAKESQPKK